MEARVQPHRPQTRAEAEGQEAERVGWPRAPAPVVRRASDGLAAQVTALGGLQGTCPELPQPHSILCHGRRDNEHVSVLCLHGRRGPSSRRAGTAGR